MLAAPLLVDAYTDYTGQQAELTTALARYCLPQIFFYGLFTLLGQVLNARGRFGAMMWTPVLSNVVITAVFGLYLAVAAGSGGTLSSGEARLLGWGTTAGIAVQALALIPALRGVRLPLAAAVRPAGQRARAAAAGRRGGCCCSCCPTSARTGW